MKRHQLIAAALATVVFLVTFNFAYLDIHIEHPFVQLFSFLALLIGSLAAWLIGNKDDVSEA